MAEDVRVQDHAELSDSSRYAIQSSMKTLQVLFAFKSAPSPLSLNKICHKVGLSRNQAYRCIKSLQAFGLVAEDGDGFFLTPKILELTSTARQRSLYPAAEGKLKELHRLTDETVTLTIRFTDDETICVATLPTTHALGVRTEVGQRSFMHAGAVPKAILAYLSDAEQQAIVQSLPSWPRYTAATKTDPESLLHELKEIRARGYAISVGDFQEGTIGIGAPIFAAAGQPIGGVSIGAPSSRLPTTDWPRIGNLLVSATREISRSLGFEVTESGAKSG